MKCYLELNQETLKYLRFLYCLHIPLPVQNGDSYFGLKLKAFEINVFFKSHILKHTFL